MDLPVSVYVTPSESFLQVNSLLVTRIFCASLLHAWIAVQSHDMHGRTKDMATTVARATVQTTTVMTNLHGSQSAGHIGQGWTIPRPLQALEFDANIKVKAIQAVWRRCTFAYDYDMLTMSITTMAPRLFCHYISLLHDKACKDLQLQLTSAHWYFFKSSALGCKVEWALPFGQHK